MAIGTSHGTPSSSHQIPCLSNNNNNNNNNNNRISIAPYGRNFRGAGGEVGSVFSESLIEQKSFKSRLTSTRGRARPPLSKFRETSYIRPCGLTYSDQIWQGNPSRKFACLTGDRRPKEKKLRGGASPPPPIFGPLHTPTWHNVE